MIQEKTDLKKLLGFGGGGVPLGQTGAVKKKNEVLLKSWFLHTWSYINELRQDLQVMYVSLQEEHVVN